MSGQIFQPNLTSHGRDGLIQSPWQYDPRSCYRPSADFGVPIICVAYGRIDSNSSFMEDFWTEFKNFSPCCPQQQSDTVTNIYTMSRQCQTQACFTSEEAVAKGFDECVKKQAELAFEKLKGEGTVMANATSRTEASGRCEYIDYAALKKGTVNSTSGSQRKNIFSVQMVLAVGFSLLLVGCSDI